MNALYAMRPDGSGVVKLRDHARQASWSPDGADLAIDCGSQICVFHLADGTVRSVASGSGPDWSPDGSNIAYQGPDGLLHVINIDGSGDRPVPTGGMIERAWAPSWSSDGTRLTFVANNRTPYINYPHGQGGIYTIGLDGSQEQLLREEPTSDGTQCNYAPAWSRDGQEIAFSESPTGNAVNGPCQIYVMRADGSGPRQLTSSNDQYSDDPSWSPDGSQIAFSHVSPNGAGGTDGRVWAMRADGSSQHQVSSFDGGSPVW